MSIFDHPDDFMCGVYRITFASAQKARAFIDRYRACPVWPAVTPGRSEEEVFVLAVELKAQQHGDFSQENNTLARNPHDLGAEAVAFRRDDALFELLGGHRLETGYAGEIPCGSRCAGCPSFKTPCQGCPAYLNYTEG